MLVVFAVSRPFGLAVSNDSGVWGMQVQSPRSTVLPDIPDNQAEPSMSFLDRYLPSLSIWGREAIFALIAGGLGISIALIIHSALFHLLGRLSRASITQLDDIVVSRLQRPTRWAFIAMGIVLASRKVPSLDSVWDGMAGLIVPLLTGWVAIAILRAFVEAMILLADIDVEDNRDARRRRTRLSIFSRIGTFSIVFLTMAGMLSSIPGVRQVGVTLMASAGLAALAVGAAAQPALKALIAGFQMAITEPISIDDVVILDGEWGRIEDIRTTYVVVRLWDERRLVVPSNRFLESTFQNWTKTSSQLLGTVMLYLDHATDVAPIRAEFSRKLATHDLWDRRAHALQVTDCRETTLELRLLMSAKDGPSLFDLRCAIREEMLEWIRSEMPEALARRRNMQVDPIEIVQSAAGARAMMSAS